MNNTTLHPRGMDTFIRAVQYLKSLPKDERPPVLVYGDPDIDGLVSMREFLVFLEKELEDDSIPYYVNNNRSHGFFIPAEKLKGYFVFCVDFAIERPKLEELVDAGVTVISVDHHDCEEEFIYAESDTAYGVVINNQYPFENQDWLFQSGMGVLYHCIADYEEEINEDFDYRRNITTKALVGLTLLSDVRNIEMPKARQFLECLYDHPRKGYIGYLMDSVINKDYSFGVPCMDRNFVDYTFSPKVNALFRFNLQDLACQFILGYGYPIQDFQELQKEFVSRLEETVTVYEYPNISFLEIPSTGLTEDEKTYVTNFVGLLASRYTSPHNVVIAYYSDNGKVGRASFRGSIQTVDFRKSLNDFGIDGRGHAAAYGILNFEKDEELFKKISDRCSQLFEGVSTEVPYITVGHLGMWLRDIKKGYRVSKENCFLLNHHRIHIRYTGDISRITKKRGNEKYAIYDVDGIEVRCFDLELNFETGLILPMLEKGRPVLQLAKEIE